MVSIKSIITIVLIGDTCRRFTLLLDLGYLEYNYKLWNRILYFGLFGGRRGEFILFSPLGKTDSRL